MPMNNKAILNNLLQDMNDFGKLKQIDCSSPFYILGGAACVLSDYFYRATTDIDIIDLNYSSDMGRLFRILGSFDLIDIEIATLAPNFKERAKKLESYDYINAYVLSVEDIILTKLGRYTLKDQQDIEMLKPYADLSVLDSLIDKIQQREDLSNIILSDFIEHVKSFKEQGNV